jgi:hypothetical protein
MARRQEPKQAVHEYDTNKRMVSASTTSRGDGNGYSFIRVLFVDGFDRIRGRFDMQ